MRAARQVEQMALILNQVLGHKRWDDLFDIEKDEWRNQATLVLDRMVEDRYVVTHQDAHDHVLVLAQALESWANRYG